MNPLLVMLGGGAILYLLAKSKSSGSGQQASGPRVRITGPSKIQWFIEHYTDMEAGYVYTKVTMPSDQFGAQGETPIFTYATPVGKTVPNSLVSLNPEAPRSIINSALSDFGVTVPAGVELPED